MLEWSSVEAGVRTASYHLGPRGVMHLEVASMGKDGWYWYVWDGTGQTGPLSGRKGTMEEAMARAEEGLRAMLRSSGLRG